MSKTALELLTSKEYLLIDIIDGEYIISFRLNHGKGTVPIKVPIKLMTAFISALENGRKIVQEKTLVDIISNSFTYDIDDNGEEIIKFRTNYGKGSKIHKIRKVDYAQVILSLKKINKDIPEVISKYEDLSQ